MTGPVRRTAAVLLAALAPLSILATRWAAGADLPDPLPTHWDLGGQVDDTLPAGVLLAGTLVVSTLLAGGAVAALARRTVSAAERVQAAGLVWAAWLAALVHDVPVLLSVGARSAAEVALPWWALVALLAVPVLVAGAVRGLVAVVREEPSAPAGPSTLHLGAGERATWVGSSSSRTTLGVGVLLLVGSAAAALVAWQPTLVLGLAGVVVLWVHSVTARVDERGLSVAWGPLGWPHSRVPLADITSASVEQIEPTAWGGWGYRVTPGATAAVTRRGPGLVVDRRSGRRFAVTVDRPEAGADLLLALLERDARGSRRRH